jgi:hypothetical protein
MYDQTECAFCFEKFSQENLLLNNIDFNEYIIHFLNQILELDCGHIFHLGCFSKYIKIKINKKTHEIECPFCRKEINNVQLIKILNDLKNISYIKYDLKSKLIKLNIQIGLQKFYLYSKGLLNLSNSLGDIFEYNKMIENYEELKFSYKKIEYILKDVKKTCADLHN